MMRRRIFVYSCLLLVFCLLLGVSVNATAKPYEVKKGDSLYGISKELGVSISEIKEANNLKGNALKPRQTLDIPQKTATTPSAKRIKNKKDSIQTSSYQVKKGDTLASISKKTGVPVKQIMATNQVNARNLRIGRKLILAKSVYNKKELIIDGEDILDDDMEEEDIALLDPSGETERKIRENEELLGKWNSPDERKLLVKVATGFLGAPYRLGGSNVRGIDCSAFVRKIYDLFDIALPRTAREQSTVGVSIDREKLEEGDLVFFHTKRSFGHVGIYIGNNEFVHASYKKKAVRIDNLDTPYFQKRFQRAVRLKGLEHNNDGA
jgi:peptidoglycan DL-endopeptidase LytE